MRAKPLQAALASALSFSIGAVLPLLTALLGPSDYLAFVVVVSSLFFLAVLGGLAAKTGGADLKKGILRVMFWSALSMGVSTAIGAMLGTAV